ncbi:extracellular sulfatase SULF-1 homolog isoform X2 [Cimex lectularius]|uniref:Sulfatase n=1 Tax=Cimex lectularius TaxID=79782 RepID=A0A8I6TF21_CIMLE|nr:extracellular sulfatase SULF-1 homolog isoform X2 [Cimex lectularius]
MWSAVVLLLAAGAIAQEGRQSKSRRQFSPNQNKERKPNIVLIMTDDQDVELGSLTFMPKTLKLLRDGGAEFRHAYTTTPMCCPSRSSMLTGMYMHNHEVYTNNGNCSSAQWQATHEMRSFATYLSNAGYRTGYFGKYLNKYNGSYIPPGWREWSGLIMNSRYYNYSVNVNGRKIKHGDDYHKDYYPDLIANESVAFLRQSKRYFGKKPVMLVLGFPAPHGPEDSAPQYADLFFNVTTHHTPSYDYAPNPDKQWILQVTGQMQPIHRQFTNLLMTKRLQTLQSVDDAVDKVYQELKTLGELDNTYIIYTSDHGYHLGQFGLVKGKSFPFEFDVRVPFLVRGPGIEPGTIIDELVLNIDLAPTFLDIAGVDTPPHMDGRSFLKLLNRRHKPRMRYPTKWPDTFLIESSGRRDTIDSMLAEAKLRESIAKIEKDLNQTLLQNSDHKNNSTSEGNETKKDFIEENVSIKLPSGDVNGDGQLDNILPVLSISKMERLAIECQRAELQAPCRPGQKWYCLSEGNRWRKHKCKMRVNHYLPTRGKKCACFTPMGTLYTRVELDDSRFQKPHIRDARPKYFKTRTRKRSVSSTEYKESDKPRMDFRFEVNTKDHKLTLVKTDGKKEAVEDDSMDVLSDIFMEKDIDKVITSVMEKISVPSTNRMKRSTSEAIDSQVTSIMGVLEDKIHILKETGENTMKMTNEGNCTVSPEGEISCSDAIYQDPKAWKASRDHLEEQIKLLKLQLDKLKGIRKHLREKRPHQAPYDHSLEEDEDNMTKEKNENNTGMAEVNPPSIQVTVAPDSGQKPKNKHRHHHTLHPFTENPILYVPGNSRDQEDNFFKPNNKGFSRNDDFDFGMRTNGMSKPKHPLIYVPDTCYCEPELPPYKAEKDAAREDRRRIKEERLRKKERKMRRKAKLESECLSEKMNCFNHDNEHWKTPPFWTEGPFCFCMNANNNTYSCLRTINATHNFLYCEFVTGLITYYNLRIDPFEQWNRVNNLTPEERSYLHDQLQHMKSCRGTRDCTVGSAQPSNIPSMLPKPTKRRKYSTLGLVPSFYPHSFSRLVKQSQRNVFRNKSMNREWRRRHGGPQWKNKRRNNLLQQTHKTTLTQLAE